MPPCSYPLTSLALSINRIPEVDQKRSERWWSISTKSRCWGETHPAATHAPGYPGNASLCCFYPECRHVRAGC